MHHLTDHQAQRVFSLVYHLYTRLDYVLFHEEGKDTAIPDVTVTLLTVLLHF